MNKPLTDQALEQLLSDYGQIAPPVAFAYQPKTIPWGKRITALSVAALLSLLLLTLTAVMIAGLSEEKPFATDSPAGDGSTVMQNTTTESKHPPVTSDDGITPPVTTEKPPVTDPPSPPATNPPDPPDTDAPLPSLLPAWYNGKSIRLVNCIPSSSRSSFQPIMLKEVYNDYATLNLDMGTSDHQFVAGDLVILHTLPKAHQESYCGVVYLRPSDGELICLGHELKDLWQSAGVDFNKIQFLFYRHASADGNHYVVCAQNGGKTIGLFYYDRVEQTLKKIPFDTSHNDFLSYSADGNYMVVANPRKSNDLLDDLFLIDLRTMEVKQICQDYDTFGESHFSSDGRYVYTHLRIGDAVDSDEHGQWVLYDTQTGFTFRGEGQVLYLEDGVLISHTYGGGFAAYDCTTGETPDDLSALPLVIDADYKKYRYILTVFNPATGEVEATIPNVGAYALSENYLFYYVHRAEGVVMADLYSAESVTLPVSAELLNGANPEEGFTHYRFAVSHDGSSISLGYFISMSTYDAMIYEDINALMDDLCDAVLSTNNIPDFGSKFTEFQANYSHIIKWIGYDIHENYAILQIATILDPSPTKSTLRVYHLVEDYRNGTYTLYSASENPYSPGRIFARSAYEDTKQVFRRKLSGDYAKTCALLPQQAEHRPYYIDYADCYDSKGKWSDSLAAASGWNYGYLSLEVARTEPALSKTALDRTLQIIAHYPLTKGISIENLTYRRVAGIRLLTDKYRELYNAEVVVASNGCYYLRNLNDTRHSQQITYEDYLALMEAQNNPIVQMGLYKDPRIAYVLPCQHTVSGDFLINCFIPTNLLNAEDVCAALALIREGGHSADEIMDVLFSDEMRAYVELLAEYAPTYQYVFNANGSPYIDLRMNYGDFRFYDPNPEAPLPGDSQ